MDNYVGMENYRHWGEQLVRCRKVAILQTERPLFEAPLFSLYFNYLNFVLVAIS